MGTGHLRGARSGIRKAGRRRRRTHSRSGSGVILTTSPGWSIDATPALESTPEGLPEPTTEPRCTDGGCGAGAGGASGRAGAAAATDRPGDHPLCRNDRRFAKAQHKPAEAHLRRPSPGSGVGDRGRRGLVQSGTAASTWAAATVRAAVSALGSRSSQALTPAWSSTSCWASDFVSFAPVCRARPRERSCSQVR